MGGTRCRRAELERGWHDRGRQWGANRLCRESRLHSAHRTRWERASNNPRQRHAGKALDAPLRTVLTLRQILTARGVGENTARPVRVEVLAKPARFTARECLPRCRATVMELSRPHRHSRRYSAGVLERTGGRNGNGGSPGIRQSRPRVSRAFAPERYSAGVPPCQFAGALTECLEVRGSANTGFSAQAVYSRAVPRHQSAGALGEYLQPSARADTGIADRACTRALATRSGECRQAS